MNFASGNWAGAPLEILDAMVKAKEGVAQGYGSDLLTKDVEEKFRSFFGKECVVFFVGTEGAANGLHCL